MKHIWQAMLPELSAEDAAQLSEAYNLSGGQIENISRKHIVDTILSGSQVTLEKLQTYCREELSFSHVLSSRAHLPASSRRHLRRGRRASCIAVGGRLSR